MDQVPNTSITINNMGPVTLPNLTLFPAHVFATLEMFLLRKPFLKEQKFMESSKYGQSSSVASAYPVHHESAGIYLCCETVLSSAKPGNRIMARML
jgi:hypothetical protein